MHRRHVFGRASLRPAAVHSKSDAARAKLDRHLKKLVATRSNKKVFVFATVKGDPDVVLSQLSNAHAARLPESRGALVVGQARCGHTRHASRRLLEVDDGGAGLLRRDPPRAGDHTNGAQRPDHVHRN